MNQRKPLSRTDKLLIVDNLMAGKTAPLRHYHRQQNANIIRLVTARKHQGGYTAILMNQQPQADMSQPGFDEWLTQLRSKGESIICIIRPDV